MVSRSPFLTAEWRHLAMLDFEVDPARVHPLVPAGTELDDFGGENWRDGATLEYRVGHPRWRVWTAREARFEGDAARLYGERFAACLTAAPASAFLVDGSEIKVFTPTRLPSRGDR